MGERVKAGPWCLGQSQLTSPASIHLQAMSPQTLTPCHTLNVHPSWPATHTHLYLTSPSEIVKIQLVHHRSGVTEQLVEFTVLSSVSNITSSPQWHLCSPMLGWISSLRTRTVSCCLLPQHHTTGLSLTLVLYVTGRKVTNTAYVKTHLQGPHIGAIARSRKIQLGDPS